MIQPSTTTYSDRRRTAAYHTWIFNHWTVELRNGQRNGVTVLIMFMLWN